MGEKISVQVENSEKINNFSPLYGSPTYQIRHELWYRNFFNGLQEIIESNRLPGDPRQINTNWRGQIQVPHAPEPTAHTQASQKRVVRELVLKALFPHQIQSPDLESDVTYRIESRRPMLASLLVLEHQSLPKGANRMIDHFKEYEEDHIDSKTFLTIAANTYGPKSVVKAAREMLQKMRGGK